MPTCLFHPQSAGRPLQNGLRRALQLVLALSLLLSCAWAWSKDRITERSWFEDPTGQMGWADVTGQPFQPYQGVLSQGYGSGAIWLRLRLDPDAQGGLPREGDRLMLRIRPVYLDNIQIFDPLAKDGLIGTTGDRTHPRTQADDSLSFLLPIARGDQPRDLWLRVQTTSTRQIAVQALSNEDLQRRERGEQIGISLYLGLILLLMIWGLVHWLFSKEPVIGAFALKQFSALVYAVYALGYSRAFWPADWAAHWLDCTTSMFSVLAVSAAIYFHLLLIREFDPHPWLARLHTLLLALLPVKLLMLFGLDMASQALRINMLEVLLAPFLFFTSVCLARGWRHPNPAARPILSRVVVLGFYGLLLLILLTASLTGLGLSQGGELPLYLVQLHGLVTAFLIMLMLQYRAYVQQKQQRDTLLALERSQLQARQERAVREDQEKLLAMLAHELKTPLATLQMRMDNTAPGSAEMRKAMRDMNAVIERCMETVQLGDRQLQARIEQVNLAAVTQEAAAACVHPDRVHMHGPTHRAVQTDRQLLFIVLSNLLEDACKYSAPDSPIDVRFHTDNRQARLEISNWPGAAGWPEPAQLFDKYHRGTLARRQAGTGLGLYLARNLMQVVGGSIVYQPDDQRIRFVLTLPTASAQT